MCGDCLPDGTCDFTGQAGDGRPDAICLQPYGSGSATCVKDDILKVEFKPDTKCDPGVLEVKLENEPSVCPGGWFFSKKKLSDCKQPFVNDYKVQATCVNNNAPANIHASCSSPIGLCNEYCGFLLVAYSILNQDPATWYYSTGNS